MTGRRQPVNRGKGIMSSFGGRLMTGGVLAVIGLITIKVVVAVVSGVFALLAFVLFTVLPIVLVGWVLMKLFRHFSGSGDAPAFE
jgi:hypothetical protein